MERHHIENKVKSFLDKWFLKVGSNIVYSTIGITNFLIEAVKLHDSIKEVADKRFCIQEIRTGCSGIGQ